VSDPTRKTSYSTFLPDDSPESEASVTPPPTERYEILGVLGKGGMGVVYRVHDRVLNRTVAMKVIHPERFTSAASAARFIDEARCSARLQHPGIVPVYDFGRMADGAPFFTMREVEGQTLAEVLELFHGPGKLQWSLQRLVSVFLRVCEAMAYAHSHGILHRDLKPANILLGPHGEALVVDWGLATEHSVAGEPCSSTAAPTPVAGTPAYMSPEQARGDIARMGPRSDVFSLGAVLFELLAGQRPYSAHSTKDLLRRMQTGPEVPTLEPGPGLAGENGVPSALAEAVRRALSPDSDQRQADAGELGAEISAWLQGARRRDEARAVLASAQHCLPQARMLRDEAVQLRDEAVRSLDAVPSWATEADKAPSWKQLDRAALLEREADRLEHEHEQALSTSLRIAPSLPEARASLVTLARALHATAEQARDPAGTRRAQLEISTHAEALPAEHPVRQAAHRYLRGHGRLTLHTEPQGAHVTLRRFELCNRRLVEGAPTALGNTPLVDIEVPMGSYMCVLELPDRPPTRYPIQITRQGCWHSVRPGDTRTTPVELPPEAALGPHDCMVPGGWCRLGGDPEANDAWPATRVWVDTFVMRRHAVTNAEYLVFLNDLVASGHEALALQCVPRESTGRPESPGQMIYGRTPGGCFFLQADAEGDIWPPDFPVVKVDWASARAYCDWLAEKSGLRWRLPTELEWEKAARGVDGRFTPWGDHVDPAWTCMRGSHDSGLMPASVHAFPIDESVYGVRGLGGNARDWCGDPNDPAGPRIEGGIALPSPTEWPDGAMGVTRGGDWYGLPSYTRSATRVWCSASLRNYFVSFRPARTWTR